MLSNIRIVLVEPSHPGNIGAVARAMKNMSLDDLFLVAPEKYPHTEATARAAGADDVLTQAKVVDRLSEAVSDCRLVFGASARLRTLRWPQYAPAEAAARMVEASHSARVALVFGRERTGLSNEELDLCHYLVHIPSNESFSSLNLGMAVQVLAYEIFKRHRQVKESRAGSPEEPPVEQIEMQRFYEHLEKVLVDLEFLDPEHPKKLMRRVRRLFNRAQPDQKEMNILRGILTAVEKKRGQPG